MNQQFFPGGWHCRALPGGEYTVLFPGQHVLTHLGPIAFADPQRQPLYLDLTANPFKMAGQSWLTNDDRIVEYDGQWTVRSVATGVSPIIYDLTGALRFPTPQTGSQGYRYVAPNGTLAGRLVTGDETYAPANGHDLNEWTALPCGLVIGIRGAAGDQIQVWDGAVHRTLVEGACRFPHAVEGASEIAISTYRLTDDGAAVKDAVLTWATEAELRTLPEWAPPPPPPPDHFGPVSDPDPDNTLVPDIAAYMAAETPWSRTGTHTMQSVRDGQYLHLGKFYDPPKGFKSKDHYESWAITDDAIHLLRDASNSPEYYDFVRTAWLPRTMKTGYANMHDSGASEIVFYQRGGGCTAGKHVGFHNRIWLQTWAQFDCGPYLGVNKVLAVMTDPTDGWHGIGRGVERGLFAMGPDGKAIANLSWEYHRSAYDPDATGEWAGKGIFDFDPPEFNAETLIVRSVFYMPTDITWEPNLVPCPLVITEGPPAPPPPPPPPPVIPPVPPMNDGILRPGQRLLPNQPLYSQDRRFFLVNQGSDGNFVKYGPNGWAHSLFGGKLIGKPGGTIDMQGDGNLVPYDAQGRVQTYAGAPIASHTSGHPGASLCMQNDGHAVMYGADGAVLWTDGVGPYVPAPTPPPPPIPPVPPGPGNADMHAWPKFGASYNAGMTNPACDPALWAALNRDAGGNLTRVNTIDAWAVGPNGTGQYAGFMPWQRDSAGVFDLAAPNPAWDERLNYYVRAQNAAGATVQLTVFDLYSWSDRKQGLLWVPDVNLGPFRRNKNGVRWGNPDDPTFLALPDWVMLQHIQRICTAVKGLAVCFETGNEMPEKDMHIRIANALRSHFTADWQPDITTNRQEDTSGQYFNMKIGTNFDRIAFHGKDSLAYLDEVFEDEPSSRPNTFRRLFDQSWPEGTVDPKRIIMSSDGCRSNSTMSCYDWPVLAEVAKDHIRRGFTFEHQSCVKMQPFLEGRLDLQKYFEADWLRPLRT
jgi:hypothetical protein